MPRLSTARLLAACLCTAAFVQSCGTPPGNATGPLVEEASKKTFGAIPNPSLARNLGLPRLEAQAAADGKRAALEMKALSLDVHENAGVAHVVVDMTFANHAARDLEGTFFYPVPEGAVLTGFEMLNGDRWVQGVVVEREKAREVFEYIKRQRKDPGLLEWAGGNLFKMRVYPIPAKGDKRIRMTLAQVLPTASDGTRLFQFPLADGSVHTRIFNNPGNAGPQARSIPAHRAAIGSPFEKEAGAFFLRLKVDAPQGDAAAGRVAVSPTPQPAAAPPLILLLDGTASMGEAPFKLALAAAESLREMNPGRHVRLAILGQDAPTSEAPLVLTDIPDVGALRQAAKNRLPIGGNDFARDLRRLGAALDQARFAEAQVVYLGDGVPSLGVVKDGRALAEEAVQTIGAKRHFSAIAIGAQADNAFLRQLAKAGHGRSVALTQAANASAAATDLLDPAPRITCAQVRFEGPANLPALGAIHGAQADSVRPGGELIITGRVPLAWDGREVGVVITGEFEGQPFERRETMRFDLKADESRADLPRLWAAAHLAWLRDEVTAPAPWRYAQAVATSVAHQIPSPVTSYLVLENEADYARYGVGRNTRRVDWRGETAGGKTVVVKAEEEKNDEARAPSPLALDIPEAVENPPLPQSFWTERVVEMMRASGLEAPALKAMLGVNQGGIGAMGSMMSSGHFSLADALSDADGGPSEPNGRDDLDMQGWEGLAGLAANPSEKADGRMREEDWLSESDFGTDTTLNKWFKGYQLPSETWGYPWRMGGNQPSLSVAGVALRQEQSPQPLWLARRGVGLHGGDDAAGLRAKFSLLQSLIGPRWSAGPSVALRKEALGLIRHFIGKGPAEGYSMDYFRLLEARCTEDAAARRTLLWALIAPGRGEAAMTDASFAPGVVAIQWWESLTCAEEALQLLSNEPDPQARRQAVELWVRLAKKQGERAADYWRCAIAAAATPNVEGRAMGARTDWTDGRRVISLILSDAAAHPKEDCLRVALDAALGLMAASPSEAAEKKALIAQTLDALTACNPEAVSSQAKESVLAAYKKLGRMEDVWTLADRAKKGEVEIKPNELNYGGWGPLMWVLRDLDPARAERYAADLLAHADGEAFDAACKELTFGKSLLLEAAAARLKDPSTSLEKRVKLWQGTMGYGSEYLEKYSLDKRALLLPALDLLGGDGNAAAPAWAAFNALLPDLSEVELAHWLPILEQSLERNRSHFDLRDYEGTRIFRKMDHSAYTSVGLVLLAKWRLVALRHESGEAFLKAQLAQAQTAEDALAVFNSALTGENGGMGWYGGGKWPTKVSADCAVAALEALSVRFPRMMASCKASEFQPLFDHLLLQGRVDLAGKVLDLMDFKPAGTTLDARDMKALQGASAGLATYPMVQAAIALREAQLPALAKALAQQVAALDVALAKEPAVPPELRTRADKAKQEARDALIKARDLRLEPLVARVDAAAAAWGAVDAQRRELVGLKWQWAKKDAAVRSVLLDQFKRETANESLPRREATTARLRLLDAAGDWKVLSRELDALLAADPQDGQWMRWSVRAKERAGDPVGAQAALRALVARWPADEDGLALRLFALDLPELSSDEAVQRAKALPPADNLAEAFKAWTQSRPEVGRVYWKGKDAQEQAQSAEADGMPEESAALLWKQLTGPERLRSGYVDQEIPEWALAKRLAALLPLEKVQTAVADDIRQWKPSADDRAETPVAVYWIQSKLAAAQGRPADSLVALRAAAARPSGAGVAGDMVTELLNAGLPDEAVDHVVRLMCSRAEENNWQRWEVAGKLSGPQGRLTPLQELRLSQALLSLESPGHLRTNSDFFKTRRRVVELLCQLKRNEEADALAAAWAPTMDPWGLGEMAAVLRKTGNAPKFEAWVEMQRPQVVAQVEAYLNHGDPEKDKSQGHADAVLFKGIALQLEPVLQAARKSGDPGVLLRLALFMGHQHEDSSDAKDAEIFRLFRRVAVHPQATAAQKKEAWSCLFDKANCVNRGISFLRGSDYNPAGVLEAVAALDALDPATAGSRKLDRFKALRRMGREAEADAVAQAWLDAMPLADPQRRRAAAQVLTRAKRAGWNDRNVSSSIVQNEETRIKALLEAASYCGAAQWASRCVLLLQKIRPGEKPQYVRMYAALADSCREANHPEAAAQAACEGLALEAPATLGERGDASSDGRSAVAVSWSFYSDRLLGLHASDSLANLAAIESHFLEKILPQKGDHPHIRLGLALAFDQLKQPARALPHWRAMAELAPAEPAWRRQLIRHLLDANRLDEAQVACLDWLAFDPRALEGHALLADILFKRNLPGLSLAARAGAADAQPMEAEGHLAYAKALRDAHHASEAMAELRRAMAAGPSRFTEEAGRAAQEWLGK